MDDDEIAKALGIEPRQTANQVCRHLAGRGALRRERGNAGKIVNTLARGKPAAAPPAAVNLHSSEKEQAAPAPWEAGTKITPTDLARTLLIIPCSGAKRELAEGIRPGPAITQSIPPSLANELLSARSRVRNRISLIEKTCVPAWQRYDGASYQAARPAIRDLLQAGTHIVILSGGYGVVLATEGVGVYEARLTPSEWPDKIIERSIVAYVQAHGLSAVRAIVSATGP